MITQPSGMLQNHYSLVSALVHQVDEPVYITENGKEDMVVMSVEAFNRREDLLKLKGLLDSYHYGEYSLAESRADVEKLHFDELHYIKDDSVSVRICEQAHIDMAFIYCTCEVVSGEESARKTIDGIYDAIEKLPQAPNAAPFVPDDELRRRGYQYLDIGSYIIIYFLVKNTVKISHVFEKRFAYQNLFRH